MAEILKNFGHLYIVVLDGEAALNLMKEKYPDLLFSGLTLSELRGMELLRQVQLIHRSTLFVLICPKSEPEKIQQTLIKGASNSLTRPVQKCDVSKTLEKLRNL